MILHTQRWKVLVALAGSLLGLTFAAVATPCYQLRYNASRSAPLGWYLITPPRQLRLGDFALVTLPEPAAALADQRGYLPRGVPLMKRIAAMGGQFVCSTVGGLSVDGAIAAHPLNRDSSGRVLVAWKGCRPLARDEFLLLNPTNHASYDSRYFGPISRPAVIGKAIPLWTW